jgi:DNA-binding transcriptional LysR family regulator
MAKLDLSDLNILKEIYQARSITGAVRRVNLSQPSISIRLSHLRRHFGDPLFVRTSEGMMPTPRMEDLLPAISEALALLGAKGQGSAEFTPSTSSRTFRFSLSNIGQMVIFPQLLNMFEKLAPALSMETLDLDQRTGRLLEAGEVDIAIGFTSELHAGFYQQRLFTEYYACIVREGHPRIRTKLTRQQFLDEAHVTVVSPGTGYWLLDKALEDQGIRRAIKVRVPSFLGLAQIIHSTDLLAVVPARLAQTFSASGKIRTFKIPVPTPSYEVKQYWHERYHLDPANRWIRRVIFDTFANMPPAGKSQKNAATKLKYSNPAG